MSRKANRGFKGVSPLQAGVERSIYATSTPQLAFSSPSLKVERSGNWSKKVEIGRNRSNWLEIPAFMVFLGLMVSKRFRYLLSGKTLFQH
jgi:hypothetical protein